jgi:hypothetical protein
MTLLPTSCRKSVQAQYLSCLCSAWRGWYAGGRPLETPKIAPSTLSHHVRLLVSLGLICQVREAVTLVRHVAYEIPDIRGAERCRYAAPIPAAKMAVDDVQVT